MSETDDAPVDAETVALAYYDAIDAGDYDRFADLLAPDVVHERPDRTIEGRDTLVGFMRDDRPDKDTSHEVRSVFGDSDGVAIEGRLRGADGNPMFEFVDVFDFENSVEGGEAKIGRIRTYTR
ncbi:nuclear transport factor 2 family protein [Halorussus ruber]|uniref:nuclear transport factor 2 family protein n=1 Tax=Halorussus ruber TaxID=1126238 RepID=UPI001092B1BA|nr:nuclear transport factor 2 family protein [Halorussus ruber]